MMADSMQEMLTCSICLDQFTNPKMLPCQHTFCLSCLRRIAGKAKNLNCPTCRQKHPIPDRDVGNFNDNLMAKNFLEMLKSGARLEYRAEAKTAKECSDCQQKMSLSKCRHCSEMVCGDCRASHVELALKIEFFLSSTENTADFGLPKPPKRLCHDELAADANADEEEKWKELLNRIENEQERLPLLFEQLEKKINQRKEEITLYLDLMKKRLQHLLREEDTPLQRSVQQRVSECKTTSALTGLKNLLDSTEATLAAVKNNEENDKFELSLESGVDAIGHVVNGGQTIEIVGAGGPTFPNPVKPDRSLPDRHQHTEPGPINYNDKKTAVRDIIDTYPDIDDKDAFLKPLYAVYYEPTDSIYCITECETESEGRVIVYRMDDRTGRVLSPLIQDASHLALTDSGKLLIAEASTISVVDLNDSERLRTLAFPAITFASQICARGNDLVILDIDDDEQRVFIFNEDNQLLREIEVEDIASNSDMAVYGDLIYVRGSDVAVTAEKGNGEKKGCSVCGRYKKPISLSASVSVPILVYNSRTGKHVETFNLDIPGYTEHYRFDAQCSAAGCTGLVRNEDSASDDILEKFNMLSLYVDLEGYVLLTVAGFQAVLVFTRGHEYLCSIDSLVDSQAAFDEPHGVSVTPDGRLVVCDFKNNRIQFI